MPQNENLAQLSKAGVSVWLDDLSRDRILTGDLQSLVDEYCVVGVTTNPTIFAAAISGSDCYDEQVHDLAVTRVSVEAGVPMGWREFVGDAGRIVGLNHYGASAAYTVLFEEFGLTDEAVVTATRESLEAARSGNAVPAGPVAATGGLPHPTGDR